jgi:drug/metabolite transporter (DMT)-like permease
VPRAERDAATWLLFLVPSFIWGTTWLVIKFQLGVVAPEASVAYRFGLAAALLFGWCALRRIPLRFDLSTHVALAATGILQFGLNYVLVYLAEGRLTSGLVAVVFSLMVAWNIAGDRLLFGTPVTGAVTAGAALGIAGVALVFWPEVAGAAGAPGDAAGLLLALVGSLVSSAANLASQRLYARGVGVAPGMAWGMAYGSLAVALSCAARGIPFGFDGSAPYLLSLAYLALLGSVIAFFAYLSLIRRVGAGRAGYTAAVIPVLAMLTSTVFEGYRWTALALAGMALVAAGTVLVVRSRAAAPRAAPARAAERVG